MALDENYTFEDYMFDEYAVEEFYSQEDEDEEEYPDDYIYLESLGYKLSENKNDFN